MIESQARVVAVEPGYAWVESERRSACAQCSSGDSCGVSSLGKVFEGRSMRMRLADPIGLQPGEELMIGLAEQQLLSAATTVYLLPLLAMIALAVGATEAGFGQAGIALISLGGLGGGLWLAGRLPRRRPTQGQAESDCQPVILRRLYTR